MNKCLANRRSNTAVALRKGVKRRNGSRIAQHYGDLPALGAQRGLTLSAGLWLGHGLALVVGVRAAHGFGAALGHFLARPAREGLAADAHVERAVRFIGDRNRGADGELLGEVAAVHVHLPSGPIPPMGEYYAVTSDVSTPSNNHFLRAA